LAISGTLDANKLVKFYTTFSGRALKWYMKSIELGNLQGHASTLAQVKQWFIDEFHLPHSEQHSFS
jgi:hypothetical protein